MMDERPTAARRTWRAATWPIVLLALLGCGQPAPDTPASGPTPAGVNSAHPPWFEEVAQQAGIDFTYESGHRQRLLFPEIMGGGAALFDMDGDGDLDAYLVQAGSLTADPRSRPGNRLYENVGQGRFRDISEGSGAGDRGYGMGVTAGDYDNDGDVDLYVTNFGPNTLLRNDGAGRFTDVSVAAGVGHDGWGVSTAFLDYDADGDLDLFVANYVNWSIGIEQDCYNNSGLIDYCLPTNYGAPAMDRLFRNDGDGTFTDVSIAAGMQSAFGNGLGVVCGDFDGDGRIDIFVANDTMMNQLWLNQGQGRFVDESLLRGCALDEHGMAKAGMGVAADDVDADGDLDLLVVNLEGQTDSFFRNEGGFFVDNTGDVGLATSSRRFTRFSVGLIDFDNDGALDLYQANGRVVKSSEPIIADPFAEPNAVYRGDGTGRLTEVSPRGGTAELLVATSRAAAFGDVDNDGGIDILVVNRDAPAYLLRNVVPDRGGWVRFRVLDERGRDALGATVRATVGRRRENHDVRSAYGYGASSDPRIHLGLGPAGRAEEVVVRWSDGRTESFGDYEPGRTFVLQRGSGEPDPS